MHKLQPGFPGRESEQGHGWAVKGAGICLSASLVSLFWLSWKELLSILQQLSIPLLPGAEGNRSRSFYSSVWLQVLAQKTEQWGFPSGKLSNLLSFLLMLKVQTLRKIINISLLHTRSGGKGWRRFGNTSYEGNMEIYSGCDSGCSVTAELWLSCFTCWIALRV